MSNPFGELLSAIEEGERAGRFPHFYRGIRIFRYSSKVWGIGLKYEFESLADAKRWIDNRKAQKAA